VSPRAAPLEAAAFAARLARFAPFETEPVLAVAVSGGRDSLALVLLADEWAKQRGGRVLALIVDHALRAGSAEEAAAVARRLQVLGIAVEVLRWVRLPGVEIASAIQAQARAARYRLLAQRCVGEGILHLLLGHQADDQAETFVFRLLRDSGIEGLAAMAACVELPGVRLLRPLLDVPRAVLAATLAARGETWVDDPSNQDPRYERVRLREAGLPVDPDSGRAAAAAMARLRMARERAVARALATVASVHPLGAVLLEPEGLARLPSAVAEPVVARAVMCAGGRDYPPRRARLAPVVAHMRAAVLPAVPPGGGEGRPPGSRDRTLGGCRVLWRSGRWVVTRDPATIGAEASDGPWDGRFRLASAPAGPLGAAGWQRYRGTLAAAWPLPGLPVVARALPAGPDGAPNLGSAASPAFRPLQPLVPAGFFPCFAAAVDQMLGSFRD
jgi:tRNA(Ile)-lysidine synthase